MDGAADGAVMVVDAVSTQAAELTEWIGTAAKGVVLVLFVLSVVECSRAVERYDWSWTAKARLFMAGRNPEANVDPRAVPFSQELVAKAAFVYTNETVARVGNYVVSLPPSRRNVGWKVHLHVVRDLRSAMQTYMFGRVGEV